MRLGNPGVESPWDRDRLRPPIEPDTALRVLKAGPKGRERIGRIAASQTPKKVTYSRNITIPVTRLCRNRCSYCSFRRDSGGFLTWKEIKPLLMEAQERGTCEALFMSGERPEETYRSAGIFLEEEGFESTPQYVAWLCGRTLDETDLLPHTNIGLIDRQEIASLKEVNASLGLMLEDASPRLRDPGMPHENSPGKDPQRRLQVLRDAGEIKVPFTTGLLLGIGQTREEILESMRAIRSIHRKYGHIQEIIIQRFMPSRGTTVGYGSPAPRSLALNCFLAARLIFGKSMNLQVPPNLEPDFELFLAHGANDLGGISGITPDYINPGHDWCSEGEIYKKALKIGREARARPPVYPDFATPEMLAPRVLEKTKHWMQIMDEGEKPVDHSRRRTGGN